MRALSLSILIAASCHRGDDDAVPTDADADADADSDTDADSDADVDADADGDADAIGGQQDHQKGSCDCQTTDRSAGALPLLLAGLLLRRRRKSA